MKDEDFEKAVNKATTKNSEIARLKKEASRHLTLSSSDHKLQKLAEEDVNESALAKGEEVLKEEKRIVGKDKRSEVIGEDGLAPKKLTTEQKISKELDFVKSALELSDSEAKHWYYQLKREYEEQERKEKILKQLEARKEFRKMMKSYKLPEVLQQEEDYEKLYDSPGTVHDQRPEEEKLPPHYTNDKEAMFYRDDIDFLKFHKRTTKNVHEEL
jgi:hypothetical protein